MKLTGQTNISLAWRPRQILTFFNIFCWHFAGLEGSSVMLSSALPFIPTTIILHKTSLKALLGTPALNNTICYFSMFCVSQSTPAARRIHIYIRPLQNNSRLLLWHLVDDYFQVDQGRAPQLLQPSISVLKLWRMKYYAYIGSLRIKKSHQPRSLDGGNEGKGVFCCPVRGQGLKCTCPKAQDVEMSGIPPRKNSGWQEESKRQDKSPFCVLRALGAV